MSACKSHEWEAASPPADMTDPHEWVRDTEARAGFGYPEVHGVIDAVGPCRVSFRFAGQRVVITGDDGLRVVIGHRWATVERNRAPRETVDRRDVVAAVREMTGGAA